jgi:hypothetical protein
MPVPHFRGYILRGEHPGSQRNVVVGSGIAPGRSGTRKQPTGPGNRYGSIVRSYPLPLATRARDSACQVKDDHLVALLLQEGRGMNLTRMVAINGEGLLMVSPAHYWQSPVLGAIPHHHSLPPKYFRAQRLVRDPRRLVRPAPHPRRLRPHGIQALRKQDVRGERPSLRARPEPRGQESPDRFPEDPVGRAWV